MNIASTTAQYLRPEDILVFSTATTGVFVITQGLNYAFNLNPRIVGLIVAAAFSAATVWHDGSFSPLAILAAIANTFLLYLSAVGAAQMTSRQTEVQRLSLPKPPAHYPELISTVKRKFFRPWF